MPASSLFAPPTVDSAMRDIREWDRRAGSMPLLSEQIAVMKDGPVTWSTTHTWPAVRSAMVRAGLVRELEPTRLNGWMLPTTEITDLGREVRAAIIKAGP